MGAGCNTLEGLSLVDAAPDRNTVTFDGWSVTPEGLRAQYGFDGRFPGSSFKEDVTLASLNVKFNQFPDHPGRVQVDIDYFGLGADLVGLFGHAWEVLHPGRTNPLSVYTSLVRDRGIQAEYQCDVK